jgi:cysteinyl-tRNA synthetase
MPFQLYNSLTRKKEEFKPLVPGHVGIYVCGPTVYSHSHLGHGKSYVSFDVLVRYLRHIGNNVLYVQNITDVGHLLDDGEDRMLKQSKIEKIHPMQIAENITRSYFEDMDALGVQRPDISPRASGHIVEQIKLVKELLARSFAYKVNGSVYFDVRRFKEYGKLSGRKLEDAMVGTRVEGRDEKHNPEDFALWKRAEPEHIMRWQSPWGEGFPGWHIECSAMSMKYLGETFDIHGGGLDNQFPHHECEIAQSESITGKPFARYWIHNNLVTVNGQKMSKSLGNFLTLKDAFKRWDPIVIRFFILQSHYRSPLDFSEAAVDGAKVGLEKLLTTFRKIEEELHREKFGSQKIPEFDQKQVLEEFRQAMDDDLNTPRAIALLFDVSRALNSALDAHSGNLEKSTLAEVAEVFNQIGRTVLAIFPDSSTANANGSVDSAKVIDLLLDVRRDVRAQKLWSLSDVIRDGLKSLGIALEDTKDGTTWKRIN